MIYFTLILINVQQGPLCRACNRFGNWSLMCYMKGRTNKNVQSFSTQFTEMATQALSDITSVFVDDILTIIPDSLQNEGKDALVIEPKVNGEDLKCTITNWYNF